MEMKNTKKVVVGDNLTMVKDDSFSEDLKKKLTARFKKYSNINKEPDQKKPKSGKGL